MICWAFKHEGKKTKRGTHQNFWNRPNRLRYVHHVEKTTSQSTFWKVVIYFVLRLTSWTVGKNSWFCWLRTRTSIFWQMMLRIFSKKFYKWFAQCWQRMRFFLSFIFQYGSISTFFPDDIWKWFLVDWKSFSLLNTILKTESCWPCQFREKREKQVHTAKPPGRGCTKMGSEFIILWIYWWSLLGGGGDKRLPNQWKIFADALLSNFAWRTFIKSNDDYLK